MIDSILSIIEKFVPDKDAARKAAVHLEQEYTKQMQLKSDIIKEESRNGSGLWRVRLMYLCMFLVLAYWVMYDLIPYIRTALDLNFYIPAEPGNTELWSFLKIGVGGYIGSRGIEKSIAHFKGK